MAIGEVSEAKQTFSKSLWSRFSNTAVATLYSPFLVCFASGDLEPGEFHHCLSQESHYFKAFAQACDTKAAMGEISQDFNRFLEAHTSILRECEFDPAKEISASAATGKYTKFLSAVAAGKADCGKSMDETASPAEKIKVAAYIVGVMIPWTRLYAFLGKELQTLLDRNEDSHPYVKWIENFASFEALSAKMETLLDRLASSLTDSELQMIEKVYRLAMQLEMTFFATQPIAQHTVVPLSRMHDLSKHHLSVFSSFYMTCTLQDPAAILASMGIYRASDSLRHGMSSSDMKKKWDEISSRYTEEYQQRLTSVLPSAKEKSAYESISKALELISDIQKQLNERVEASDILRGIYQDDIKQRGLLLELQDGCAEFFKKLVNNENLKAGLHIISSSWSVELIRSALPVGIKSLVKIYANDLAYVDLFGTTGFHKVTAGKILKRVESPFEKVQIFKKISEEQRAKGSHLSVYIGASVGDLLCLLEADVGIVFGPSECLRTLAREYGVSFLPLFSGLVEKQKEFCKSGFLGWKGLTPTLYTVSSWDEIHAFFLGDPEDYIVSFED